MADLATVAQIVARFYRLVGTVSEDQALVLHDEAVDAVAYEALTQGSRLAQLFMLDQGYQGWRKRTPALVWRGTDAADGGRYMPLPGADVIKNGGLDSDDDWTQGSNGLINGGYWTVVDPSQAAAGLEQALSIENGAEYSVAFSIRGRTAGTVTAYLGGMNGTARSTDGRYVETIRAAGTTPIEFEPSLLFDGRIDDVEVRQVSHQFLRAFGSTKSHQSAIVEADGNRWGSQIEADQSYMTGDLYYVRDDELWLAREASPPTTAYLEYHYAHAPWSASSVIDFPMMARELIPAYAAWVAADENWVPGGEEMLLKIERSMRKAETMARKLSRQTKEPRRFKKPTRLVNHW